MMATRRGLVKKTPLSQYSRPQRNGIIAIKLKEDDELVDVAITKPGDEMVLSTARGMAIRFRQTDARPMGRNTSGVKGITLTSGDELVGMVVAEPDETLLTVCRNGYGKRTPYGPNIPAAEGEEQATAEGDGEVALPVDEAPVEDVEAAEEPSAEEEGGEEGGSSRRYRTQRRGGKGLRDIKTTERNGPVISVVTVSDDDEILLMTARGKIQRVAAKEISVIGRNTQGVRIMTLDEEDTLAAAVRVPREERGDEIVEGGAVESPDTAAAPPVEEANE
jgi:DNA gyrase subunit A